jgi:predicted O-methyltransferase YrrM
VHFNYCLSWRHLWGAVKHSRLLIQTVLAILKHLNLFISTLEIDGNIAPPNGVLLYETVFKAKNDGVNIIEVGSFKGLSTIYLAKAAQKTGKRVKSFDLFSELPFLGDSLLAKYYYPGQPNEYKNNLEKSHVRDVVDLKIGDARETLLPELGDTGFCLAFIDVAIYEVMREILFQLHSILRGGEIIIVHDIHSPVVRQAVIEFHEKTKNIITEKIPVYGTAMLSVPLSCP